MKKIRIKYFNGAEKIEKIQCGDWIDLKANKEVVLNAGEEAKIPLGVAMELPEGYEAHVVPRSSTFKKWGIIQTNHMGIIDHSYCGDNDEWQMPVYCLKARDFVDGVPATVIHVGDRVCQFRIVKSQLEVELVEVEVLGNTDRGGFGSTGSN